MSGGMDEQDVALPCGGVSALRGAAPICCRVGEPQGPPAEGRKPDTQTAQRVTLHQWPERADAGTEQVSGRSGLRVGRGWLQWDEGALKLDGGVVCTPLSVCCY